MRDDRTARSPLKMADYVGAAPTMPPERRALPVTSKRRAPAENQRTLRAGLRVADVCRICRHERATHGDAGCRDATYTGSASFLCSCPAWQE